MRCSPAATDGGASICTTRSTAPMSMPSSRLEVATTAGSWPDLSASSICLRSSRETLPWWARATTGGAPPALPAWAITSAGSRGRAPAVGSAPATASRGASSLMPGAEPLGAAPRVGEHDGRAVRLDQVEDPLLDGRPDRRRVRGRARLVGVGVRAPRRGGSCPRPAPATVTSMVLALRRLDDLDGVRAAEEPGGLVDRAHGRGQADPLGRLGRAARRAAPGTAPGGRRAWWRRPRAPRR